MGRWIIHFNPVDSLVDLGLDAPVQITRDAYGTVIAPQSAVASFMELKSDATN